MRIPRLALALAVTAACGEGKGGEAGAWRGTMDTLPNGTIVVSSPAEGVWDSAGAWTVIEDLRIGTAGEGPSSFSDVLALEVDPSGRIYILDRAAQEVRVFDSTGRYVRPIGRKGRGPGEFVGANGLAWGPAGRLWVVDQEGGRYTLFETTGRVNADHVRNLRFYAWQFRGASDTAGRLLEDYYRPGPERTGLLLRFNQTFTAADTFPLPQTPPVVDYFEFAQGTSRSFFPIPFVTGLSWLVDPHGSVWFGHSEAYRIYQRRLEGDTVRIVIRAVTPVPVTAAEEDSAVARIVAQMGPGTMVDRSRIPKVKPLFSRFIVDDGGRLWVAAIQPPNRPPALDVFDPEGRYLGGVLLPFKIGTYAPVVIRGDHLYAAVQDDDGVPYVVRARIRRLASS